VKPVPPVMLITLPGLVESKGWAAEVILVFVVASITRSV
jgi:hypothetical protein